MTRRKVFAWLIGLPLVGSTASFLAAALAFVWPPKRTRSAGFLDVGAESDIEEGQGKVIPLESGPVLLLKKEGQVRAFSAACTHLGCPVRWQEVTGSIYCACHGGVFDASGSPVRGPVRKSLRPLALKIIGGRLHLEEG